MLACLFQLGITQSIRFEDQDLDTLDFYVRQTSLGQFVGPLDPRCGLAEIDFVLRDVGRFE
jgi:hypothetical protein